MLDIHPHRPLQGTVAALHGFADFSAKLAARTDKQSFADFPAKLDPHLCTNVSNNRICDITSEIHANISHGSVAAHAASGSCRFARNPNGICEGDMDSANIDSQKRSVVVSPARYVLLSLAQSLTGYTVKAMQRKIERGDWPEGKVWKRAPDGRICIDVQGYERWIEGR